MDEAALPEGSETTGSRGGPSLSRVPPALPTLASDLGPGVSDLGPAASSVARQWALTLGDPLPGATCSLVLAARDAAGRDLVLTLARPTGPPHLDEARDEAAGLRAWRRRGAVAVVRSAREGDVAILLLERCRPGTALATALPPRAQDEVIAALARRLRIPAPAGTVFRPLAQMCAWWADEAAVRLRRAPSALPRPLLARGLALLRTLPCTWAGPQVLLATDLHGHNVLHGHHVLRDDRAPAAGIGGWAASAADGWTLIDPKPYVGDPHYEPLQHMLNHPDRLRTDPGGFADRMAHLAGLDAGRLRLWLLARCVQEAGRMAGAEEAALHLGDTPASSSQGGALRFPAG